MFIEGIPMIVAPVNKLLLVYTCSIDQSDCDECIRKIFVLLFRTASGLFRVFRLRLRTALSPGAEPTARTRFFSSDSIRFLSAPII